jgi:hypothetical protein
MIVALYSGGRIPVSQEEGMKILKAIQSNQKFLVIAGQGIAVGDIRAVTTEEFDKDNEEKDHKLGVLHDGTRVIRQFGQWFCLNGTTTEEGYNEVKPDPAYYPEIAMDCVPSVSDFEKNYRHLMIEERKQLMTGGKDIKRYSKDREPERLGNLLS